MLPQASSVDEHSMKRTPLKRFTPLRRRSKKRERADFEYEKLRRQLLDKALVTRCAAHGFLLHHCSGPAVVHHVLRRSQGGTNDPSNLIVVCNLHHKLIHDNPVAAVDAGFLRWRAGGRLR